MRVFYKILLFGLSTAFLPLAILAVLTKAWETDYIKRRTLKLTASGQSALPSDAVIFRFSERSGEIEIVQSAPLGLRNVYHSHLLTRESLARGIPVFTKIQNEQLFLLGSCEAQGGVGFCHFIPKQLAEDDVTEFFNRVLFVVTAIGILAMVGIFWTAALIVAPLERLARAIQEQGDNYQGNLKLGASLDDEIGSLASSFQHYVDRLEKYRQIEARTLREEALAKLAAQVAHDIRSPLSALQMALDVSNELDEEVRVLMRTSISRITDIASTLLSQRKSPACPDATEEPQLLSAVIDSVASEKRALYSGRPGVEISCRVTGESYGLFSRLNPSVLKRVVSNLLDKAVQAIEHAGEVEISLTRGDANRAVIYIRDTGRGIPGNILPKLMKEGATFGKAGGTGLGLYHAREAVERWGGDVKIQSEEGVGTEVSLWLELCGTPNWFLAQLDLRPGTVVAVVDDDKSIHEVWKARLRPSKHIQAINFMSIESFLRWSETQRHNSDIYFLIDYEFKESAMTGLELIRSLGIQGKAALVTSHYDERGLQLECTRDGVRLIPKGLAPVVPIFEGGLG